MNVGSRRMIFILVCLVVFISSLSVVLFYHFVMKARISVIDRFYHHEISSNSKMPKCMFGVAVWTVNVCRKTFDNLALFQKFPNFPDQKYCVKDFSSFGSTGIYNTAVIKRILVSFSRLEPGFYQFRAKTSLPLKIYSGDGSHQYLDRVLVLASNASTKLITVFSRNILLKRSSFLEIITYCPQGMNILSLEWLVPGSARFRAVLSVDLGPVVHMNFSERSPARILPPEKSTLVGFIPRRHVMESIHVCSFHDTRVWKDNLKTREITVYTPSDLVDGFINEILKLVMAFLQKTVPRLESIQPYTGNIQSKYPAYKINKLELTRNSSRGELNRVLIDLNLTVDGLDYVERFSEYLFAYYHKSQLEICRPLCFQWNRPVTLSFVFLTDCSRNDQPWGLYFIDNTIEQLQRSLEVNMMVVITACDEEQRRNYESRLRYSDIDRNVVVLLKNTYKKSRSLKDVLSLVGNNVIVVLCESTVRMPAGFSEEIRKHTFRTLMAYSPVSFQLECGHFPESTSLDGHWCPECAGVTAMYKEDWEKILSGSYDNENEDIMEDKEKLLSHIKKTGMEIAQVKLKDLYSL